MSTLVPLLPLFLAWGLGLALSGLALGKSRLWGLAFISAAGLGVGAISLFYFWTRSLLPWHSAWFWAALSLAPAGSALWLLRREWIPLFQQPIPWRRFSWQNLLWVGFFLAAACLALWRYAAVSRAAPYGEWDAIAIWNLHARFLYLAGESWKDYFAIPYTHPDYPLLAPGLVAAGWSLLGREAQRLPQGLGLLFLLATACSLAVFLQRLRGWRTGLLAGALLLLTPAFTTLAAWQYADVPLAFFTLLAAGLMLLAEVQPSAWRGALILAGFSAGLAAWTKNEGWSVLLALALSRFAWQAARRGWKPRWAGWGWFGLGLLAPLVTVLVFKWIVAPPGDLFGGRSLAEMGGMAFDPARWLLILQAYARCLLSFGGWVFPLLPLLGGYAVLRLWLRRPPEQRFSGRDGGLFFLPLLLIQAQYLAVYLVTPLPLAWHLRTSLDRLFAQTYPLFLLWFFLVFPVYLRGCPKSGTRYAPPDRVK